MPQRKESTGRNENKGRRHRDEEEKLKKHQHQKREWVEPNKTSRKSYRKASFKL